MILVKVINGEVVKFPYSLEDLRQEYPNVSFPANPPEGLLNAYGVYTVKYYPYPEYDIRTQNIIISNSPVLIDGFWSIKHEVVNKTIEEIDGHDNAELLTLRTKILNEIDNKTNELIVYGWVHNGVKVRLTIEDQINFEGEFNLIKDFISTGEPESKFFPVHYKVWTNDDGSPVFITLVNITELRSFLCGGKKYIRDCLSAGWVIKNDVINSTLEQLKVWKDSRITD